MAAIPAPPPRTQVPVLRPTAIPAAAATTTLKRPRGDPIARIRDECVTNRAGNRRSADAAPDGVLLGSSGAQAWHVPHSTTPPPRPPCSPAPTDQTDQTESTDHTHIRGVHEELHVQECTSNAVDYRRAQAGSLLTNCHDSSASRHRPSNLARAQGDNRVDGVTVSEAGSRGPHGNASCVVEGGGEGGEGEGLWWGPQPRPPSTASETTPRPGEHHHTGVCSLYSTKTRIPLRVHTPIHLHSHPGGADTALCNGLGHCVQSAKNTACVVVDIASIPCGQLGNMKGVHEHCRLSSCLRHTC